jgi:predicted lipoprotein with Yx(FWY)xxD motif
MKTTMQRFALVCATLAFGVVGASAATMLTTKDGMTLYTFDKDTDGVSSCYDDCAVMWPAYLGKEGDEMMKDWTLVKRTDGTMQWAYEAKPLYLFKDDKKKDDMTGDGVGGVWHIIKE